MEKTANKTAKKKTQSSQSRKEKAKQDAMFKNLESKLNLSEKQISVRYKKFMKNYPRGEMSKGEFVKATKKMGNMKRSMAESLFRVFDEDESGTMDFEEFMLASNCSNMACPEDRLEWIFNLFDEDGGGVIDMDEVIKMVMGIFRMNGEVEDKEVILACVIDLFDIIDVDGDGEITKEEFVDNAMKSGFIQNLFDDNNDTDDEEQANEDDEEQVKEDEEKQGKECEMSETPENMMQDDEDGLIMKEIKKMTEAKLKASK